MQTRSLKPLPAIVSLLLAAVAGFLFTTPVTEVTTPGVTTVLPARVGAYEGIDILFCQDEQCLQSFDRSEIEGELICTTCGGALDPVARAERQALPPDTVIMKKRYERPHHPPIFLSVVLSGTNPRSIHRPQQCLPAQGKRIESSRILNVDRNGQPPLRVNHLHIRHNQPVYGGSTQDSYSLFVYWFISPNHETPSTLGRLICTARDRVFLSRNYRWAYVAVITESEREGSVSTERMQAFLSDLAPFLRPGTSTPDQDGTQSI